MQPHDLTIPLSDLVAGVQKTYTTTGISHDHKMTLTAADFSALQKGQTVTKYICLQEANSSDHEFAIQLRQPQHQGCART